MRRRRAVRGVAEQVCALEGRALLSAHAIAAVGHSEVSDGVKQKVKAKDAGAAFEGTWNWEWDGGGDGTLTIAKQGNGLVANFSRPTLIMGSGPAKAHGDKIKMKVSGTVAYPFKVVMKLQLSDADHMAGSFKLTYTEKVSRPDSFSTGISATLMHT